ncbi:MAG TPA: LacI family DNA-binding transcriptional regulator [Chloroflexota bacterium]|nr:LacI family DNA-binding transcriptional regulator [Chloroflexota bacterium]
MGATLRDVARMAGVSLATASRAVNGTGGRAVSPEKRARILEVVNQLNYQPAAAQRSAGMTVAAARRTNNIGLVLRATYRFSDPFWSPVLDGVTEEILRQGYHIRFSYIVDDLAHHHRRRLLSARHIDGLILIGDMGLPDDVAGPEPPEHMVVIAGFDAARWESDVRFDVITMEKLAAMDRLVGHMAALGHRRLAFLGPTPDHDRRADGFVHALARHGLPLVPELMVECGFSTEAGYAAARALLSERPSALDGMVCACDTMAIGAIRAAKECGLTLPADLAIAGYDNIPFSRDLDPPLTTVHVPKELMGELAARRLIDRITHPEWPPIIQVVPTTLVARASCGEPS